MSCSTQVSDKIDPADLVSMIDAFNPDNTPGRLAVVVRMGAAKVRTHLPALIKAITEAGKVRHLLIMCETPLFSFPLSARMKHSQPLIQYI